jgi:addiction module HigA family antidote
MFNPPHPASILRKDVLPSLGLSVSAATRQLGVSRVALSRVLSEHAGTSVHLARRIEAHTESRRWRDGGIVVHPLLI